MFAIRRRRHGSYRSTWSNNADEANWFAGPYRIARQGDPAQAKACSCRARNRRRVKLVGFVGGGSFEHETISAAHGATHGTDQQSATARSNLADFARARMLGRSRRRGGA